MFSDHLNEFKFTLTSISAAVEDASAVSVKQVYLLLFSSVLRRLLPVYLDEVGVVLAEQELPGIEDHEDIKVRPIRPTTNMCNNTLLLFHFSDAMRGAPGPDVSATH